jgi:Ca2+-binding EF-hand superfamily protein
MSAGLKVVSKPFTELRFGAKSVRELMSFMDPSGEGDVDEREFADALRRASLPPDGAHAECEAAEVMLRIEEFLGTMHIRVADLFHRLDGDGSGHVDPDEFIDGITWLMVHGELPPAAGGSVRP